MNTEIKIIVSCSLIFLANDFRIGRRNPMLEFFNPNKGGLKVPHLSLQTLVSCNVVVLQLEVTNSPLQTMMKLNNRSKEKILVGCPFLSVHINHSFSKSI